MRCGLSALHDQRMQADSGSPAIHHRAIRSEPDGIKRPTSSDPAQSAEGYVGAADICALLHSQPGRSAQQAVHLLRLEFDGTGFLQWWR